jgi:hypothetical protein
MFVQCTIQTDLMYIIHVNRGVVSRHTIEVLHGVVPLTTHEISDFLPHDQVCKIN